MAVAQNLHFKLVANAQLFALCEQVGQPVAGELNRHAPAGHPLFEQQAQGYGELASMHGLVDMVRLSPLDTGVFAMLDAFRANENGASPLPLTANSDCNGYWRRLALMQQVSHSSFGRSSERAVKQRAE